MTDAPSRPAPGQRVTFRWTKWDGSTHWEHECVYLGRDRFGDWVGQRDGWRSVRPGRDVVSLGDNVTLMPPSGEYAATFNATHPHTAIYIDVAWDVRWSGEGTAEAGDPVGIDMDLDVVRSRDERGTWIDDRDEWEEHRVAYGYPADVVARLEQRTTELAAEVAAERAPFDAATSAHWLTELDRVTTTDPRAPRPRIEA